jgi:hypothetical protein
MLWRVRTFVMTSEYLAYQACTRVQYWARYNIQQSNHKSQCFQRSSLFDERLKECHWKVVLSENV